MTLLSPPVRDSKTVTRKMLTLLVSLSPTLMMLTTTAMAQSSTPSPPPSPRPTWRRGVQIEEPREVDSETGTTAAAENTEEGSSEWPWWWPIAVVAGSAFVVVVLLSTCICLCCRRSGKKSRAKDHSAEIEMEAESEVSSNVRPTEFRRMNSSAAKRYLHNVVSVFSWGSDFEAEGGATSRPVTHLYANPQSLALPGDNDGTSPATSAPPARPSKGGKGDQLYTNVSALSVPQ